MSSSNTLAIVPIRLQPSTKQRLAQVLDITVRQQLVKAMLIDVLSAISHANSISRCVLVTSDANFSSGFAPSQFELFKSKTSGLNQELTEYIQSLKFEEIKNAIVILADLPLLTASILDEIIQTGQKKERPVIAQDWRRSGTNILYFNIPPIFNFHFGKQSFQCHMTDFLNAGLKPIIYTSLETALDLDDNFAIAHFLAVAASNKCVQRTNTYRLLKVDEKRKGKAA